MDAVTLAVRLAFQNCLSLLVFEDRNRDSVCPLFHKIDKDSGIKCI